MQKMPIIFIGHGSPMNAIESNRFTNDWKSLAESFPKPRAIILFSAHWITEHETRVSLAERPSMIYDMYGFPSELYRVQYPVEGDPELAQSIVEKFRDKGINAHPDNDRGIDHGEWSVLTHMYPEADVPVVSLSVDYHLSRDRFLDIGKSIAHLRDEGVLIMASGNMVHNLRAIDWTDSEIYPWAREFDERVVNLIEQKDFHSLLDFESWGDITRLSHPTVDHFLPLLPLLGAVRKDDSVSYVSRGITLGSLDMRSIIWGV